MAKISRYPNLDLLRALAVMIVVFYHCCNLVGVPLWMWKWLEVLGSSSVELFCILSGFLIGSIYWEEKDRVGQVNIKIFILRRIYRTVPMYYLFMVLAYIAVYVVRDQDFSWTYLFFLQNYEIEMPFYVISWTLCVEEHFYLLMPFLVWLFLRIPKKLTIVSLAILFVLPLLLRFLYYDETIGLKFGYDVIASHFRYESLLLGVVISQILRYHETFFDGLLPYKYFIYASTLVWIRIPIMFLWSFTIGYIVFRFLENQLLDLEINMYLQGNFNL